MTIDVKKYLDENYSEEELRIIDGFDEAFVGVGYQFHKAVTCYDKDKMIEILIREGMSFEEALEYFEFNIVRGIAYLGEQAPIIIEIPDTDDYNGEDL
jgi:hypothetical protein